MNSFRSASRFPLGRVASCLAALCVPLAFQLVSTAAGPVPDALWPLLVLSVWASLMTAALGLAAVVLCAARLGAGMRRRKGPHVLQTRVFQPAPSARA